MGGGLGWGGASGGQYIELHHHLGFYHFLCHWFLCHFLPPFDRVYPSPSHQQSCCPSLLPPHHHHHST